MITSSEIFGIIDFHQNGSEGLSRTMGPRDLCP